MMQSHEIFKQMFDCNKNVYMTFLGNMNAYQEQMEKMWKTLLDQGGELQKEGEKVLADWLDNMRKGREEFRRNLEEGLRKMEDLLGQE